MLQQFGIYIKQSFFINIKKMIVRQFSKVVKYKVNFQTFIALLSTNKNYNVITFKLATRKQIRFEIPMQRNKKNRCGNISGIH